MTKAMYDHVTTPGNVVTSDQVHQATGDSPLLHSQSVLWWNNVAHKFVTLDLASRCRDGEVVCGYRPIGGGRYEVCG